MGEGGGAEDVVEDGAALLAGGAEDGEDLGHGGFGGLDLESIGSLGV